MKRFEFSLQAVLTLRKMRQEQALETYAAAVQDCAKKRADLLAANRRADDLMRLLGQKKGEKFSAAMRQAYIAVLEATRTEIKEHEKAVEQAEAIKEKRLKDYLDQKRNAEVLEHLREKQEKEHVRVELRKEELEIEELVLAKMAALAS